MRRNTLALLLATLPRTLKIYQYHQIASALDRWSAFFTKAEKLDKNDVPKELASYQAIVKAITAERPTI